MVLKKGMMFVAMFCIVFLNAAMAFKDVGLIIETGTSSENYCISVDEGQTSGNVLEMLNISVDYDSTMQIIESFNGIEANESHTWAMWLSTGNRQFSRYEDAIIADYDIGHAETVLAFGFFQENEGRIPNRLEHNLICPRPQKGPFRGRTTDFSKIWFQNLSAVENLTIENEDHGMIVFNKDRVNIHEHGILADHFEISELYVRMPSSSHFNNLKPTIHIYNVPYDEYVILLDGSACPEDVCLNITQEETIVTFQSQTTGVFEIREKSENSFIPEEYSEEDYRISIALARLSSNDIGCESALSVSVILRRFRETFIDDAEILVSIPKLDKKIRETIRMQELFKRNYSFNIDPGISEGEYELLIELFDSREELIISKSLPFSKSQCSSLKDSDLDVGLIDVVVTEGETKRSPEKVLQNESSNENITVAGSPSENLDLGLGQTNKDNATQAKAEDSAETQKNEETEEERRARLEKEDAQRLERALALAEQKEKMDAITGSVIEEPPETLGLVEKLVKFVIFPLIGVAVFAFGFVKVKSEYDKYVERMEKEIEQVLRQKKK